MKLVAVSGLRERSDEPVAHARSVRDEPTVREIAGERGDYVFDRGVELVDSVPLADKYGLDELRVKCVTILCMKVRAHWANLLIISNSYR